MFANDRTQIFIDSMAEPLPPYMEELRAYAASHEVPVIRRQSEPLLAFVIATLSPGRVLEIGTAIGYSAIFMSGAGPDGMVIDTIDRSKEWLAEASANLKRLKEHLKGPVNILEGEAAQIVPGLTGPYDMIFMDGAKGQYLHFLPEWERLLRRGGILVSDNILLDGDILKPRLAVTRRDRTMHARMREYVYTLTHSPCWRTFLLPEGDGTALSVRL